MVAIRLNSWSRRESMVCVGEFGANEGHGTGRGFNPRLLSRAASVSNDEKNRAHSVLEKPSNYR